jgi:hypothetical protein
MRAVYIFPGLIALQTLPVDFGLLPAFQLIQVVNMRANETVPE